MVARDEELSAAHTEPPPPEPKVLDWSSIASEVREYAAAPFLVDEGSDEEPDTQTKGPMEAAGDGGQEDADGKFLEAAIATL